MSQKPVLLITGCRKYEDYLRAAIKRMNRDEWTIIGIRGSPPSDCSGGSATFDETTRILTLPVSDLYENLPAKMHAAFKWIHEHYPGIPGLFKTDDDMLFDIPALVAAIKTHEALPYWGIAAGMCKGGAVNAGRIASRFEDKTLTPSHQSAIYCFGWGYWLAATSLPLRAWPWPLERPCTCSCKNTFLADGCRPLV